MEYTTRVLPKVWIIINVTINLWITRLKGSGVDEPDFTIELRQQEKNEHDSTSTCHDGSIQCHYKLSCGPNYQVKGTCRGRKDGQQVAAQKMLKVLKQ